MSGGPLVLAETESYVHSPKTNGIGDAFIDDKQFDFVVSFEEKKIFQELATVFLTYTGVP